MLELFKESWAHMVFALLCWHYVADFALQNDYMVRAKEQLRSAHALIPRNYHPEVDVLHRSSATLSIVNNTQLQQKYFEGLIVLTAHCFIHAFGVLLITGYLRFAAAMLVMHFVIDYIKSMGRISYAHDQLLHVLSILLISLSAMAFIKV